MRQKPLIFVFACAVAFGPRGAAAAQRSGARPAPEASAPAAPANADDTRDQLEALLKQYPPSLPQILKLDPTLLQNSAYLVPYPALAAFLDTHAEVEHNPAFFFADYGNHGEGYFRQTAEDRAIQTWRSIIEGFEIVGVVLVIASGIIILLKTIVDYRRWSRLTKIQADVHTKLLDRFTSNEDLLGYIQTPAGRKFLESSPVSLDSPRSLNAPFGRILWASQAGAVLTVLGIGIEVISSWAVDEVAAPISAVGAVVIALGVGFLFSAVVAYFLSRRFGLMEHNAAAQEPRG